MAIWNEGAGSNKCPGCGSNILFDTNFQKMVCRSCGSFYTPNSLNFEFQLRVRDKETANIDDNRREYMCDSCGSVVVTDSTTSATMCAFCGSPALVGNRLSNDFQPDYIIPFKFDITKAQNIFRDWARNFKRAPRSFSSEGTVQKIQGIYVPFWLIDAECHLDYKDYMDSHEKDFKLEKVPFDGARDIPNNLMSAIEPFDYSELVPYHDGYLHGYKARRYDVSAVDMTETINHRLHEYLRNVYESMHRSQYYGATSGDFSYVGNLSESYALLPVYVLNYQYKDDKYLFVINGQTEEVQGIKVPFSKVKMTLSFLLAGIMGLLALALLVVLTSYIIVPLMQGNADLLHGNYGELFMAAIAFICCVGVFLISKFFLLPAYKTIKKAIDYNILDEKPDVSEYFSADSVKTPHKRHNQIDID